MRIVALVSGGLDSLLSVRLAEQAGYQPELVLCNTGFGRPSAIARAQAFADGALDGERRRLHLLSVERRYLDEVVWPESHAGSRLTAAPCSACRRFLLCQARALADPAPNLVVTGDVLGQSHPAQGRSAFEAADRDAGLTGRVWRPLSDGYLGRPAQIPAGIGQQGQLQGKARRGQEALAHQLGLAAVPPSKGGCCRLADVAYRGRLRDDLEHEAEATTPRGRALLAVGRHYRLGRRSKAIVARNGEERSVLERLAGNAPAGHPRGRPGPYGLLIGEVDDRSLKRWAGLLAGLDRRAEAVPRAIEFRRAGQSSELQVEPIAADELEDLRV